MRPRDQDHHLSRNKDVQTPVGHAPLVLAEKHRAILPVMLVGGIAVSKRGIGAGGFLEHPKQGQNGNVLLGRRIVDDSDGTPPKRPRQWLASRIA